MNEMEQSSISVEFLICLTYLSVAETFNVPRLFSQSSPKSLQKVSVGYIEQLLRVL